MTKLDPATTVAASHAVAEALRVDPRRSGTARLAKALGESETPKLTREAGGGAGRQQRAGTRVPEVVAGAFQAGVIATPSSTLRHVPSDGGVPAK
ncbi:MAG: hypothetical protein KF805_03080 [Phycisphaeraceae bacterium]|nr:hypothetical protein [Phycisphaeraceae bacterium]